MPGGIGTRYVAVCPPSRSPRNTSKIASAITPPLQLLFLFRNQLLQFAGHLGYRGLAQRHRASAADDNIIFRSPGWVEARMIDPAVSSAALFARERAECNRLGHRQHRFQILGEVPAGIEQSRTFDAHMFNALLQFLQLL